VQAHELHAHMQNSSSGLIVRHAGYYIKTVHSKSKKDCAAEMS